MRIGFSIVTILALCVLIYFGTLPGGSQSRGGLDFSRPRMAEGGANAHSALISEGPEEVSRGRLAAGFVIAVSCAVQSGDRLAGVRVGVGGAAARSVLTNQEGVATIELLEEQTLVQCSKEGYIPKTVDVSLRPRAIHVDLTPAAAISGVVTIGGGALGADQVELVALAVSAGTDFEAEQEPHLRGSSASAADGTFSVGGLVPGIPYRLLAKAPGSVQGGGVMTAIFVPPVADVRMMLYPVLGARIEYTLLEGTLVSSGALLPQLQFSFPAGLLRVSIQDPAVRSALGNELRDLSPTEAPTELVLFLDRSDGEGVRGSVSISGRSPDFEPFTLLADLGPPGNDGFPNHVVQLARRNGVPGSIAIRMEGSGAEALRGSPFAASVRLWLVGETRGDGYTYTAQSSGLESDFVLSGIPEGAYHGALSHGFLMTAVDLVGDGAAIVVRPGEMTQITAQIPASGRVRLEVHDSKGLVPASIHLSARKRGSGGRMWTHTYPTDNGVLDLGLLPEGQYEVGVSPPWILPEGIRTIDAISGLDEVHVLVVDTAK